MEYDLRPRIRHWIAIGSGFATAVAIGLTALLAEVTTLVVAGVVAWFVTNLVVLWHRSPRETAILTVLLAAATVFAQSQTASPVNIMLYAVTTMTVVVTLPLRYSAVVIAAVGLYMATLMQPPPPQNVRKLIPYVVAFPLAFIYFLGLAVRQAITKRLEVEALATTVSEQNERLRISNEQLDRMAAREERTRIARDLHDGLGHSLMAINVNLRVVEGRTLEDEQSRKATARALEATQVAMRELRQCVGLLRESQAEPVLTSAIKKLAAALPTSQEVDLQFSGTPRRIDPVKEVIIFRVLQEALTNIAKHANAGAVAVELAYHPDMLELSVADDGVGTGDVDRGYGLLGLSERLDQAGGKLTIASRPGRGFTLTATVPVPVKEGLGHLPTESPQPSRPHR